MVRDEGQGSEFPLPSVARLHRQASMIPTYQSNHIIPFIGSNSIKFFSMSIQVPADLSGTKGELVYSQPPAHAAPVTRRQNLRLYKAGICPRLSGLLNIEELPFTWVERQLEATVTQFLKKWAGLAKSANISLLYFPQKMGGLNLPSLSVFHKQLQVSRQCQLLASINPCVCHLAEKHLKEDQLTRKIFKPAVVVALAEDPSRSRNALAAAAKKKGQKSRRC